MEDCYSHQCHRNWMEIIITNLRNYNGNQLGLRVSYVRGFDGPDVSVIRGQSQCGVDFLKDKETFES